MARTNSSRFEILDLKITVNSQQSTVNSQLLSRRQNKTLVSILIFFHLSSQLDKSLFRPLTHQLISCLSINRVPSSKPHRHAIGISAQILSSCSKNRRQIRPFRASLHPISGHFVRANLFGTIPQPQQITKTFTS